MIPSLMTDLSTARQEAEQRRCRSERRSDRPVAGPQQRAAPRDDAGRSVEDHRDHESLQAPSDSQIFFCGVPFCYESGGPRGALVYGTPVLLG